MCFLVNMHLVVYKVWKVICLAQNSAAAVKKSLESQANLRQVVKADTLNRNVKQ